MDCNWRFSFDEQQHEVWQCFTDFKTSTCLQNGLGLFLYRREKLFALLSVLLFIPPTRIRRNPPRFTWIGVPCHGNVFMGFFQRCVTWVVTLQNCGLKTKCQRLEILEQWCVHCSDSISHYWATESFLLRQTISFNVWRAIGRGVVAWVSATCGLQWGVHCTIVSINRKRFFGSSKCDPGVLFKAVLKNPSWTLAEVEVGEIIV